MKRRRFEQRRRQHYDMKNALRQGRELAQHELEDEFDDDKDFSHEQRNVVSTNRVGSLRQQAQQRDQQNQRQDRASAG